MAQQSRTFDAVAKSQEPGDRHRFAYWFILRPVRFAHDADQGGLARPIAPRDAPLLTGLYREVDVIEHLPMAAAVVNGVTLANIDQLHQLRFSSRLPIP
jgi:hypothetical protein